DPRDAFARGGRRRSRRARGARAERHLGEGAPPAGAAGRRRSRGRAPAPRGGPAAARRAPAPRRAPMIDPVFLGARNGWLEVISGVMFSGKSEELIRRVRRAIIGKKKIQVFKSHLDDRYSGVYSIASHDGRTVEAVPVDSSLQIAQQLNGLADVVAIDEAQFLDSGVVDLSTSLPERGIPVILPGTGTHLLSAALGAR